MTRQPVSRAAVWALALAWLAITLLPIAFVAGVTA